MRRKIRRRTKHVFTTQKPKVEEKLYPHGGSVHLNQSLSDRISFSVLRNPRNDIRKIENISYEVYVHGCWEWVVRYDDHGGTGQFHRHIRASVVDQSNVESSSGIKKYKSKNHQLTWAFKEIKRNYLLFRSKFLKRSGLDLY